MITDEMYIAVWMITNHIFQRNREMRRRQAAKTHMYCALILRLLQQNYEERSRYCQAIVGYNERLVGALLRGEQSPTKEHSRIIPNTVHRLVELCRRDHKRSSWCIELEAITFLFWLACGTSYRVVSFNFDIPRTTVYRIAHKFLDTVIAILPTVVRLPPEERLPQIGEAFSRKANSAVFRQCVGAIDGCHVRVLCPNDLHDQYYNRKQFYSINLQGRVNDSGLFIDIVSGFPGSVHDSRVFSNSALFQHGLYPPESYFIVGDSGYPCKRHPVSIITPYKAPLTAEKRAFNHALSKARIVVEKAFGVLKVRWRIIFTVALEVKIETAIKVIAACVVMHNICITQGDIIRINEDHLLEPLPPRRVPHVAQHGNDLRDLFLRLFTIEQGQNNQ